MIDIPYASEPRPDTGVSNATLGLWLFLASEVMLFGALFSSYVLLRMGSANWPDQQSLLNVGLASINTMVMLASSAAIVAASAALRRAEAARFRGLMASNIGLGFVFLAIKGIEYGGEIGAGLLPATSNFLGLYFTMTGLHALHVAGGVLVNGYLLADSRLRADAPVRFLSRIRTAALYWNFVDAIWLVMFVVLYLL
jgi:heme/copper-type cytochrome/quinol oxidase subunit 3